MMEGKLWKYFSANIHVGNKNYPKFRGEGKFAVGLQFAKKKLWYFYCAFILAAYLIDIYPLATVARPKYRISDPIM